MNEKVIKLEKCQQNVIKSTVYVALSNSAEV